MHLYRNNISIIYFDSNAAFLILTSNSFKNEFEGSKLKDSTNLEKAQPKMVLSRQEMKIRQVRGIHSVCELFNGTMSLLTLLMGF